MSRTSSTSCPRAASTGHGWRRAATAADRSEQDHQDAADRAEHQVQLEPR
ncbi:hypothetical protein [Quadrisphaera sp. DSM 44207]|nr:hypothetical protein [Quadrisphaera sp. DSM 44207]